MSNVFSPNGFTVVRRQDGAAWTGNLSTYSILKTNTNKFYAGDPIIRLSTGYIDVNTTLPTQGVAGIFTGCRYLSTAQGRVVWSAQFPGADAAADVEAYVIDDPSVVLRVWVGTGSSSAAGGPGAFADTGQNFSFKYGTANTLDGISGAYADYATFNTTNTLPFTMIGAVTNPPGVNGTDIATAGNIIECTFNQQAFRVGTTGI